MALRSELRSEAGKILDKLEDSIETVRVAYERYFSGVDKTAPARQKERVARELRNMERVGLRTTALRFRLAGLRARFVTYKHYWARVESELERGVSRRDLLRNRRPSAGSPKAPAAPAARESDGLDPKHLRDVFQAYVAAKKAAGLKTDGLSYAALVRRLQREVPKLKERHGCKSVRFEVSTSGGKVRLRALPAER